ncbi:MAG: hypothetical protein H6742_03065 [Alphaproteobacteria bacterium]|nr:hypothetical protein [Alphaproteobacteria bacterium]
MPLRHLQRGGAVDWVEHPELLGAAHLSCVDGRSDRAVLGTPGGAAGEIVAVLAAAEQQLGRDLDDAEVDTFLEQVSRFLGGVYHHSDELAVGHLRASLAERGIELPEEPKALQAWLSAPPEALREDLLVCVGLPDNIGCGHLAAMIRDPAAYGVRAGLVQAVIRAFYTELWAGTPKIQLEVLVGPHKEEAVVVVRSDGAARSWGRTAPVVPQLADSVFVFHVDAARWYRRQLCRLIDDLWGGSVLATVDREALVQTAHDVADRGLAETLRLLAPDLPFMELTPPPRT